MKEEFKVATMREQAETAMACGGMFAISGQQAKRMLDRIVELESQIERITAQRLQENSMNLKVKLHLNERATNAEAELERIRSNQPVSSEFYSDGKWWPFMSEDHKQRTIAAGYEVRDLYDRPQNLSNFPYDVLFKAIGNAVNIQGEAIRISVKAFKAAIEAAGGKVAE